MWEKRIHIYYTDNAGLGGMKERKEDDCLYACLLIWPSQRDIAVDSFHHILYIHILVICGPMLLLLAWPFVYNTLAG